MVTRFYRSVPTPNGFDFIFILYISSLNLPTNIFFFLFVLFGYIPYSTYTTLLFQYTQKKNP